MLYYTIRQKTIYWAGDLQFEDIWAIEYCSVD